MKCVGLFEAKTKLSEICDQVAKTHVPVTITRRGVALVRIEPIAEKRLTIRERRAEYMGRHGGEETADEVDFEPANRSWEASAFQLGE